MKKILFVIVILYVVGFILFACKINNYDLDTTTKTQAIVVVTGGKNRIETGVELLNKKMAEKLFISGVSKTTSFKSLKIEKKDNIELGYDATTTLENAFEVKDWLLKNNIKSIRLVTSNYHLPRALLEIKHENKNVKIIENPIFSDNIVDKWWGSFNTSFFIFVEFNKFLCVFLRNLL
ncbi:MAG: YdcF family protein [Alphaproteobacteria bacterium]